MTAGIVFLFVLGVTLGFPSPPRNINPLNPNDADRLKSGVSKSALVIGGGLAGMSAALELSDRGYDVTIREANPELGGKLKTEPANIANKTFQVEHGFHAWFHNYYQFKDIRQRLGIDGNFKPWQKVHFVFKKYKPEVIYSSGPYPFNLMGIINRSPNLNLLSAMGLLGAVPDLTSYDFRNVYQKYDHMTALQWKEAKGVPTAFYDIILEPAVSVTLNNRSSFSAAELLTFIQLYFLSDSEADHREVVSKDFGTSVINPWADRLRQHGARIHLGSKVNSLVVNMTTGAVTGSDVDPAGTKYDYVILSPSLRATQLILTATAQKYASSPKVTSAIDTIMSKVGKLQIAPPYKVLRAWFDKQLDNSRPDVLETPAFAPINLIAQFHMLEDEYKIWASQTGGSVIEFHLYTWPYGDMADAEVWAKISPTVKLIYPEIFEQNFKVLGLHVNSLHDFPSSKAGMAHLRPTVNQPILSGIPNMYLAGDWVNTSYPSALMEKAVSTGREAANYILLNDHVKQATMTVPPFRGPGIL
ncbi:carotenoid phi-ring synthase-like [Liolophura sinensis]|uniref:carotenoid phi-ring synthase-like n=1 Tax=Liolophura sinensis TaxID=3198878 RepID=UPI003158C6AE